MSAKDHSNLILSLRLALDSLKGVNKKSSWTGYYSDNNYSETALNHKSDILIKILSAKKPKIMADLGSNTGHFSRLLSKYCSYIISVDFDPHSVEQNFITNKSNKHTNILSIINDLTNPSPSLGWENKERMSLLARLKPDFVLALALVHHLYFTFNLKFTQIASFFAGLTSYLVIEFIPLKDSQIDSLIGMRSTDFRDYDEEMFLQAFSEYFSIEKKYEIKDSLRTIYLMKKK